MSNIVKKLDSKRDIGHPIFIVSGVGGHVFPFQVIAKKLSTNWNAYGLLYPGFVDDEPSCLTIESLAERMIKSLKKIQPEGPYFLAGYSMGGYVCFEIAKKLKMAGEVTSIIIIDVILLKHAPLKPFIKRLPKLLKWKAIEWIKIHLYKDSKYQQIHRAKEKNYVGEINLGLIGTVEKVIKEGRIALANYQLVPSDTPICLIRCEDIYWYDALRIWPVDYGWSNYGIVKSVAKSPGDHLTIIKHPNITAISQKLEHLLEKLQ